MARPKGSKNKKTLLSGGQIEEQLAAKRAAKAKLEGEEQDILASLEELKLSLRSKRKELRAADKAIKILEEKKLQADAIAVAAAQKEEIEKAVSKLVSSGKTAEEILDLLK